MKYFYLSLLLAISTIKMQAQHVGIGTNTPGSKLTVSGSFAGDYQSIEGDASLNVNNFFVSWTNNNVSNGTIFLPAAQAIPANFKGRVYHIKNSSTRYLLTVAASGTETINTSGGLPVSGITVYQGEMVQLISTGNTSGVTWEVVNQNITGSPNLSFWKLSGNTGTNPANHFLGTTDVNPFVIKTNGTERMRITETGNIGIGTIAPTNIVDIRSTNPVVGIRKNTTPTTVNNFVGAVFFGAPDGASPNIDVASVTALATQNWLPGANGTLLRFVTTPNGSAIPQVRMVVNENGNVGIGTTAPGSKLSVEGSFAAAYRSTTTATLGDNDFYVAWNGTSPATISLPVSSAAITGRIYYIKNTTSTQMLTLSAGLQTIDDGNNTNGNSISLAPNESATLICTGASTPGWDVISHRSGWKITGNSGTNPVTHFVGNTDKQNLVFRTNNTAWLQLDTIGRLKLSPRINPSNPQPTDLLQTHLLFQKDSAQSDWFDDYVLESYGQKQGSTTDLSSQSIYFRKARGKIATPAPLQNGDLIGQLIFAPYIGDALNDFGFANLGSQIDAHYRGGGTDTLTDIRFSTSGYRERMRIDTNGAVLIGHRLGISPIGPPTQVFNPSARLHISDTGNATTTLVNVLKTQLSAGNNVSIKLGVAFANNDAADISFGYNIGNTNLDYLGLGFHNLPSTMHVVSNGRVAIGLFDNTSITGLNHMLNVFGTAYKSSPGGSWVFPSDVRIKKNINPYRAGLKEILAINPVSYQYNGKVYKDDEKTYVGIIAQEIEKVLPGTVTKVDNKEIKDLRQFDGSELTYTLINAIKEQQGQIETMQKENTALKTAFNELTKKIEVLEQNLQNKQ